MIVSVRELMMENSKSVCSLRIFSSKTEKQYPTRDSNVYLRIPVKKTRPSWRLIVRELADRQLTVAKRPCAVELGGAPRFDCVTRLLTETVKEIVENVGSIASIIFSSLCFAKKMINHVRMLELCAAAMEFCRKKRKP